MDRREAILARLSEVLSGIEGIRHVERNRDDADEHEMPCALLLDSDETADEAAHGRGRPAFAQNLVSLTPEIFLVLRAPRHSTGPELNKHRVRIIKAVLTDPELTELCADGDIRYEGCFTPFGRGRTFQGEMRVDFTFVYRLNPMEL